MEKGEIGLLQGQAPSEVPNPNRSGLTKHTNIGNNKDWTGCIYVYIACVPVCGWLCCKNKEAMVLKGSEGTQEKLDSWAGWGGCRALVWKFKNIKSALKREKKTILRRRLWYLTELFPALGGWSRRSCFKCETSLAHIVRPCLKKKPRKLLFVPVSFQKHALHCHQKWHFLLDVRLSLFIFHLRIAVSTDGVLWSAGPVALILKTVL